MKADIRIQRYASGNVKYIHSYLDGVKHGQLATFYESGLVKFIGNYVNGKECGVWKEWYSNGELMEECLYHDNKKQPINFWNESGEQILKDGTGHLIAKFGANDWDVYHQFFENGIFIKEVKVSGIDYGGFFEDQ